MKIQNFIIGWLLLAPALVSAQPLEPMNPTPIDGGVSLLIAGGAAIAAARYRKINRDKNLV